YNARTPGGLQDEDRDAGGDRGVGLLRGERRGVLHPRRGRRGEVRLVPAVGPPGRPVPPAGPLHRPNVTGLRPARPTRGLAGRRVGRGAGSDRTHTRSIPPAAATATVPAAPAVATATPTTAPPVLPGLGLVDRQG